MKNDASLLDIFERLPGEQADFAHTKPSEATPADDIALLFGAFGVQTFRASLVDLGSMRCTHAWHITPAGTKVKDTGDGEPDRSFPSAMATIVQLSPAGPDETQMRRLDPLCWAFAWRVNGRHVAVVEARYRSARGDHGDADVALVRQVCDAGVRAALAWADGPTTGRATTDIDLHRENSTVELASSLGSPDGAVIGSRASGRLTAASAGRPPGTLSWPGVSQRVGFVVLALGLALAGILYSLLHASTSLRMESAQLQAKVDATMTQMVGKALAEGDYGEVQAELASFASLKYFERALVMNKRGRVIAATGPIQGIRMGDPLAADVAGNARVIELNDNAGRIGQLLVWHSAAHDATGSGGKWLAGTAMLVVVGAAATAALLLQRRQRRATAHR